MTRLIPLTTSLIVAACMLVVLIPTNTEAATIQSGAASWYGPKFHGRLTANGERFNMNDLTAAHRTLPFDTHLKVTNTQNGCFVVVRVNDRGPFHGNRIIDLSRKSAETIDLVNIGVGHVEIETTLPTEERHGCPEEKV